MKSESVTHADLRRLFCRFLGHYFSRHYCRPCRAWYLMCNRCGGHPPWSGVG